VEYEEYAVKSLNLANQFVKATFQDQRLDLSTFQHAHGKGRGKELFPYAEIRVFFVDKGEYPVTGRFEWIA